MLRKEIRCELRGKHGLFTSLLFSVVTVAALGIASARGGPAPSLAAGMLWVALLFAAITGVSRTFLLEEEQGTGDLLRLWGRPEAVFWGKALYNFALIALVALVVTPLFMLFIGVEVVDWGLLIASLLSGCVALASAVGFGGSLVSRSASRAALAGVISVPVLLPVVILGSASLSIAFGGVGTHGWNSVIGATGLAVAYSAAGPYLYAAVWKQ